MDHHQKLWMTFVKRISCI